MINLFLLVLTWHLSVTMTIFKPLGVKLCEELCVSYGQCNSPLYVEQQLECFLTETETAFTKLAIHLPAPKRDTATDFYRVIFARSKKQVTTKGRNLCKRPTLAQNISKTYTTVKVGKTSINIKLHKRNMTWTEARKVCQAEGGDLVKADTKQKNRALRRYMEDVKEKQVWIGLADMTGNDTYLWIDGSPLLFTKWFPLQPSHIFDGQDEDCVHMDIFRKKMFTAWGWNDVMCSLFYRFFCEYTNL